MKQLLIETKEQFLQTYTEVVELADILEIHNDFELKDFEENDFTELHAAIVDRLEYFFDTDITLNINNHDDNDLRFKHNLDTNNIFNNVAFDIAEKVA